MKESAKPEPVLRAQLWLQEHQDEILKDLQGLLRIPSVEGNPEPLAPFGKAVREALDYVLDLGRRWGFRTKDVDGYAGHAEIGEGREVVMAIGHLDVVPAGDGWRHDPFGAEIENGYVYARGAEDDKGPTMAAFYAIRALGETQAPLPCRLRMVFGCNEESGFRCVKHYFQVEESPTYGIAPDGEWPLVYAEKGIANLTFRVSLPQGRLSIVALEAGTRPNVVPEEARMVLRCEENYFREAVCLAEDYWDRNVSFRFEEPFMEVTAKGWSAHGSTPFLGDNALERVLRVGWALSPPEDQKIYERFLALAHPSGVGLGLHGRDEVSHDLTANLAMVSTEDGFATFVVNVRYPVTWKGEEVRTQCERFLKENFSSAEVVDFSDNPPLYFPIEEEPVKTILRVYRQETGEDGVPKVMGGGTYARAIPNTVAIGTGWEGDGPAHQRDERLILEHLGKMAQIYTHILYALCQAAGGNSEEKA